MSENTSITATTGHYISSSSTNYTTARNGNNEQYRTLTAIYVGQEYIDSLYSLERAFLKFDTSSLSGSEITKVNLKMVVWEDRSDDADFDIEIVKADWSDYDPIDSANAANHWDLILSATADQDWRNTSGISTNTVYTSPDLDTTWINRSGYTYYGLRSSRDSGNNAPGDGDYEFISLYSPTHATTGYRPVLYIEYEPPVADLMFWFI
jgi:hypothetical protein